jgi:hypothetical protein
MYKWIRTLGRKLNWLFQYVSSLQERIQEMDNHQQERLKASSANLLPFGQRSDDRVAIENERPMPLWQRTTSRGLP